MAYDFNLNLGAPRRDKIRFAFLYGQARNETYLRGMEEAQISEIVAMAWDDLTAFDMIEREYGLSEDQVIRLMRRHMKASSFRMWRKRVSGRLAKHTQKLRPKPSPQDSFEHFTSD